MKAIKIVFKDGSETTYSVTKCIFQITECAFVVVTDKFAYCNYVWDSIKYIVPLRKGETEY